MKTLYQRSPITGSQFLFKLKETNTETNLWKLLRTEQTQHSDSKSLYAYSRDKEQKYNLPQLERKYANNKYLYNWKCPFSRPT